MDLFLIALPVVGFGIPLLFVSLVILNTTDCDMDFVLKKFESVHNLAVAEKTLGIHCASMTPDLREAYLNLDWYQVERDSTIMCTGLSWLGGKTCHYTMPEKQPKDEM